MNKNQMRTAALLLLLCFLLQTLPPLTARAAEGDGQEPVEETAETAGEDAEAPEGPAADGEEPGGEDGEAADEPAGLTTGEAGIRLIESYEGFSAKMYSAGGRWYIGYGTQCAADAYPDGITQEEAEALLREKVSGFENTLNSFFARRDLTPTQSQFDALVSFTYNFGSNYLYGNSSLVKIITGEREATRLAVARAFAAWCHTGGAVSEGLLRRRLEEAAIYLDGDAGAAKSEFAYLAITKDSNASYATDVRVYERGGVYDSFPAVIRLGYTLKGFENKSGKLIAAGDTVTGNQTVRAVWEKNVYETRAFPDVAEGKWYYHYVMELSEAGAINGNSNGTFAPTRKIRTSEALKLVLTALGVEKQPSANGHWAGGYANYALEHGYLPESAVADLNGTITRRNVARLAAKALGFGQSGAASPFSDVNDGYVTALYEIGVLKGTQKGDELVFLPDNSISRGEVAAIVWRLYTAVALGKSQSISYGVRTLDVKKNVPFNSYEKDGFSLDGTVMTYVEDGVTVKRGIDVSRHQGTINWKAVKADGIEFAMLRVGGRYWGSGGLYDDVKFEEYYAGATAAGLPVGVYFFSQAITPEEAVEEAEFVLEKLAGKTVACPVSYDWESTGDPSARTEGLKTSVLNACAKAFCERIEAEGYDTIIYMNSYDGYLKYDVGGLTDYDFWYATAAGAKTPGFFYDFRMWQYTDKGRVNGVDGNVDMDLWFFRD